MLLNRFFLVLLFFAYNLLLSQTPAGYELWMDYKKVEMPSLSSQYSNIANEVTVLGEGETIQVIKNELLLALPQMLGSQFEIKKEVGEKSSMIIATWAQLPQNIKKQIELDDESFGNEGFALKSLNTKKAQKVIVTANSEIGLLYGTFRLLAMMQQHSDLTNIDLADSPKIDIRMLNHWDNLDRTVERGYAGFSLWNSTSILFTGRLLLIAGWYHRHFGRSSGPLQYAMQRQSG